MSASLEFEFTMTKGSSSDLRAIMDVLIDFGYEDIEDDLELDLDEGEDCVIVEENPVYLNPIEFPEGLIGDDYLETDSTIYKRLAKAAPMAEWTAGTDRCNEVDGSESKDKASYAKGVLVYSYIDYFQHEMDYEELCEYVEENGYSEDEDDEAGGLTLEQLEDCFESVGDDVKALLKKKGDLKKKQFCLLGDGSCLALFEMTEQPHIIREYFADGKESEDLDGKTIVITGKLNHFDNRDAMVEFVEDNGGHVAGSVSKKTDFLVCNDSDSTSSKAKKAAELGIPVITEDEFIGRFGFPGEYDEED